MINQGYVDHDLAMNIPGLFQVSYPRDSKEYPRALDTFFPQRRQLVVPGITIVIQFNRTSTYPEIRKDFPGISIMHAAYRISLELLLKVSTVYSIPASEISLVYQLYILGVSHFQFYFGILTLDSSPENYHCRPFNYSSGLGHLACNSPFLGNNSLGNKWG